MFYNSLDDIWVCSLLFVLRGDWETTLSWLTNAPRWLALGCNWWFLFSAIRRVLSHHLGFVPDWSIHSLIVVWDIFANTTGSFLWRKLCISNALIFQPASLPAIRIWLHKKGLNQLWYTASQALWISGRPVVNIPIYSLFLHHLSLYYFSDIFSTTIIEIILSRNYRYISHIFPIKYACYLTRGTLGTCSNALGNFLLRQVVSKVLCSA